MIIESHGQPKAALISVAAYNEIQELREQQRRAQALERLGAVRDATRARNLAIATDDQTAQVAEEFSQEFIQMLKEKRSVRFDAPNMSCWFF